MVPQEKENNSESCIEEPFEINTLIFDMETTGLPPKGVIDGKKKQLPYDEYYNEYPYIVSFAYKINEDPVVEVIIDQEGRDIPKEASDIHGITKEIAEEHGVSLDVAIIRMLSDCDCINDSMDSEIHIVVGHNIYFDTSILKANMLREVDNKRLIGENMYGHLCEIFHKYKRIDTMRSTIKMMGKWPKLEELYQKIFKESYKAHSAGADVEVVYKCYQWLSGKGIVPSYLELQAKAREKEAAAK